MTMILIIACAWVALFALSLGLAAANGVCAQEQQTAVAGNQVFRRTSFPLESTDEECTIHSRSIRTVLPARETIYVVDDDPGILNLLHEVLKAEGYQVRSFTDPTEALEDFKHCAERPSMLLTDYSMKAMNGMDLLAQCRTEQPGLRSIVISGVVDEAALGNLASKSDRFISKPFAVSNLLDTLHDTLAEARN